MHDVMLIFCNIILVFIVAITGRINTAELPWEKRFCKIYSGDSRIACSLYL